MSTRINGIDSIFDASGSLLSTGGGGSPSTYLLASHTEVDANNGGNSVVGFNRRDYNTEEFNNIPGASLDTGTSTFSLPAGTYRVLAFDVAFRSSGQGQVRKTSDSSILAEGLAVFQDNDSSGDGGNHALMGVFTLTERTDIEVGSYRFGAFTDGLGFNIGAGGGDHIYGQVLIEQLPDTTVFSHSSPDWDLIGVQDASNSAQIDMLFDPSLYDEILVIGLGIVPATDDVNFSVRVSEDGGATFEAGATDYRYALHLPRHDAAFNELASTGTTEVFMATGVGNATGEALHFELWMPNPGGSAYKTMKVDALFENQASVTMNRVGIGNYRGSTNAIDGLRFLMSSGNISSGKFILRGRRKVTQVPLAGGQLTPLTVTDVTSAVASVDFTFDPFLYDRIEVDWQGLVPATDAVDLRVQFSDDGGSTFFNTVGDYHTARSTLDHTGTESHVGGTNSGAMVVSAADIGNLAAEGIDGGLVFRNPGGATRKRISGQSVGANAGGNIFRTEFAGQFVVNTNAIDAVRVLFSSGNIASGRLVMRGIKKVQ